MARTEIITPTTPAIPMTMTKDESIRREIDARLRAVTAIMAFMSASRQAVDDGKTAHLGRRPETDDDREQHGEADAQTDHRRRQGRNADDRPHAGEHRGRPAQSDQSGADAEQQRFAEHQRQY